MHSTLGASSLECGNVGQGDLDQLATEAEGSNQLIISVAGCEYTAIGLDRATIIAAHGSEGESTAQSTKGAISGGSWEMVARSSINGRSWT